MLEHYLKEIFETAKAGDAREESYYPALKTLLETYATETKKLWFVTQLPKRNEGGNPDFRIIQKRDLVGYIEAKAPTEEDLDKIERTEQLKRYRSTFPNVVLTNFFEFRLYRNGEPIKKVLIGRPFAVHKLKIIPPAENIPAFNELLEQFAAFSTPRTTTAKQLATELAKRTRFLRDNVIAEELREARTEGRHPLAEFYEAFKRHLISALTESEFADLFAQTITYGLFAARSRATDGFSRATAEKYIPRTIGILRHVFKFVSSADLPKTMEWIIDDIAEVLAAADVKNIIETFYKERKGRDPIVHFYETFLSEYDPATREKRGVYYTPEPVVGYIVRSIQKILQERFGAADGFASPNVTMLDPAAGTLTFPAEAIRQAAAAFTTKYGAGGIGNLISDHILKDFYAFELLMAPYAIGHLKIGFVLDELGHRLGDDERFRLYLTNTLDFTKEDPSRIPGIWEQTIAEESQAALEVKERIPIMVVMGNPPYSGISENKGDWITEQIEEYKKVDGKPLGERKHWLQDDYVKFFRFAQWKIEQSGQGILGFITNHAWLDNPTFRGMRNSILKTFNEIYILNLHGSTLKKEKTPDGGKDENVFDIQPGVAITIAIKQPGAEVKSVHYTDRWGLREEKYEWLDTNDVDLTKWQVIKPASPWYFLVPRDERGSGEYQKFWKIPDIFPVNSTGVLTGRDDFAIDFDRKQLEQRIRIFRDSWDPDDFIKNAYKLKDKPNYKWFVSKSREQLRALKNWEENIMKILYRPFDERWIYYHPAVIFWPRPEVMRHMLQPNLGLLLAKRVEVGEFHHASCTASITDHHTLSLKETNYLFPLYLYHAGTDQEQASLLAPQAKSVAAREPNISPKCYELLERAYKKQPAPEEIFFYIYAVLYAPTYRERYQEFLKIDFPRVPFTGDYKLFQKLAELGKELVDLHLLKSPELDTPIAKFHGEGGAVVGKRRYDATTKRVYINNTQYFEGIELEIQEYMIGGYQVLDKWLKDRKDRRLSAEDIKHYCCIATALTKTIEIQKEVDKLYPSIEKGLLTYGG